MTLAPGNFHHSKLFVVDATWTLIGSANWDARSLRLNFEFNVEVYDAIFAERMHEWAMERARSGEPIDAATFANRPRWKRLRDRTFGLLAPYL